MLVCTAALILITRSRNDSNIPQVEMSKQTDTSLWTTNQQKKEHMQQHGWISNELH